MAGNNRIRSIGCPVLVVVIGSGLLLRTYWAFVPKGAKPIAFLLASCHLTDIESPNGKIFEIRYNDAGAAHSGNFWTWVVDDNIVLGKRIVAEGYLTVLEVIEREPLQVEWDGETPIIDFSPSRRSRD